jgi:hypothetical protein
MNETGDRPERGDCPLCKVNVLGARLGGVWLPVRGAEHAPTCANFHAGGLVLPWASPLVALVPPLVDGFYWIRFGEGFTVAERTTSNNRVFWNTPGSDDFYVGDEALEVVSGPLAPPTTRLDSEPSAPVATHELAALRAFVAWASRVGRLRLDDDETIAQRDKLVADIERARAVDELVALAAPFGLHVATLREIHKILHESLDRLLGAFFAANRGARTSSTIHELMTWSHAQAFAPETDPTKEPDP